jgi:hypothetical protein
MVTWKTAEAQAGATVVLEAVPPSSGGRFSAGADVVRAAELSALGEDGVVFRRYGPVDPFPDWYHLWSEEHLDVRFCVLNGTGRDWSEAKVSLFYPAGWSAKGRKPGHWPEADRLQLGEATVELGAISSMKSAVAPFQIKGPHRYDQDFLTAGKSKHYPSEAAPGIRLATRDAAEPQELDLEAVLMAKAVDGSTVERRLKVTVRIEPIR